MGKVEGRGEARALSDDVGTEDLGHVDDLEIVIFEIGDSDGTVAGTQVDAQAVGRCAHDLAI